MKQSFHGVTGKMNFRTKGLDADQTESAIKATEKMLNIIENKADNA
ncbi:MAG: hypothetical protein MZV63_50695 [Marinilabiliales bacterium]|nr:hypothetical protein [Marinilabiliales bacterium]